MARSLSGGERVAIVFGNESRGLENSQIELCQRIVTIPTSGEASSLNLAQSVLILLYECAGAVRRMQRTGSPEPAAVSRSAPASPEREEEKGEGGPAVITGEDEERLMEALKDALLRLDVLHGDNPDAVYDELVEIDLSKLVPLAACPHSPDNVKTIEELSGMKIDQVCIGSCTNSSLMDMMKVAHILKGKTVNPDVSLSIAPGSKQVLNMLAKNGALAVMIDAGARILESACGPCIGMGQSPNSKGVSLRTFNRNFEGRSGTRDAQVYLVSPETAAISALTGVFTDPRTIDSEFKFEMPAHFDINDNMIVPPASEAEMDSVTILRGPNIKPFPETAPLAETIDCGCSLKVGDNITTDHIMPAGAKILPLRSNIPAISNFCFTVCDEKFPERAKSMGKSIIVGGSNYGQGSSREHAALAPLYLGVKAVLVKSFARIHRANLINAGILPLTFVNEADYDNIAQGDELVLADVRKAVSEGKTQLTVVNKTNGKEIPVLCELSGRTKDIILAGGLLDYTRESLK